MKNKGFFGACRAPLILVLIITALCCLTACGGEAVATKADIAEKMDATLETDSLGYDYAVDYVYHWGIRNIDAEKISWVERVFSVYYNYEGGLPAALEHARRTTEMFLAEYYDLIDLSSREAVTDALLTCYVDSIGDPYSMYRVAEEFDDFSTDMSGKFGGIGALVEYNHQNKTLMVSSVYIDSPAASAGILPGDYFYAVDGKTVEEIGYLDVIDKVRGEIGSSVKLTMKRGDALIDFTVIRAEVEEKTVGYSISDEKIGYIQITGFKGNTFKQFAEAVDFMEANGAEGIIFDLRANPGGYLTTVCDMLSYIVPSDHPIVSYQYKGKVTNVIKSYDDIHPTLKDEANATKPKVFDHKIEIPMAVICNEYTASAGEIFTAALRDWRQDGLLEAVIVGKTTYKKGIMQNTYQYTDGSSITLTVAYYNPPCGENYHGVGVIPDFELDNTAEADLQLEKAHEELKKLINANNS